MLNLAVTGGLLHSHLQIHFFQSCCKLYQY